MLINLIISLLIMDAVIIIKRLKSKKDKNYSIKLSYNNEIHIFIIREGEINQQFNLDISLEEFCKINQYFSKFKTPNDLLNELNERLNSCELIEDEMDDLILKIFIPKRDEEISLKIKKKNINTIDIYQLIEQLNKKVESLEKVIQKLKEENKKIKEDLNFINIENIFLKYEKKQFNFQINKLEEKIKQLKNENEKNNFHWINDEVIIENCSKYYKNFSPEIILNKSTINKYYLSDGIKDHFIEFSFIKTYFLKSIRISILEYECSLRKFSIEIYNKNGNKYLVGLFVREKYTDNVGFQEFPIEKYCKKLRLNLIDNWGSGGGNYILINKIEFLVSN